MEWYILSSFPVFQASSFMLNIFGEAWMGDSGDGFALRRCRCWIYQNMVLQIWFGAIEPSNSDESFLLPDCKTASGAHRPGAHWGHRRRHEVDRLTRATVKWFPLIVILLSLDLVIGSQGMQIPCDLVMSCKGVLETRMFCKKSSNFSQIHILLLSWLGRHRMKDSWYYSFMPRREN